MLRSASHTAGSNPLFPTIPVVRRGEVGLSRFSAAALIA
jgi:hypothetical protein